MKRAIKEIDRALRELYNIDADYRAEDFLVPTEPDPKVPRAANRGMEGALLIREQKTADEFSVGIYLGRRVRGQLRDFHRWVNARWTFEQIRAFAVAAEEVSHFHYFLYQVGRGRALSHLELELQGEVDCFTLIFFANLPGQSAGELFERTFEQLFGTFHFREGLEEGAVRRYQEANRFARAFLLSCRDQLVEASRRQDAIEQLRRFYRMNLTEKISRVHA